jgi:hypothetical protein
MSGLYHSQTLCVSASGRKTVAARSWARMQHKGFKGGFCMSTSFNPSDVIVVTILIFFLLN